eukprot:750907-Hanusia_phi.AAC.4
MSLASHFPSNGSSGTGHEVPCQPRYQAYSKSRLFTEVSSAGVRVVSPGRTLTLPDLYYDYLVKISLYLKPRWEGGNDWLQHEQVVSGVSRTLGNDEVKPSTGQ